MNRSQTAGSLGRLPSVDRVLRASQLVPVLQRYAREPVVRVVRAVLQDCREEIAGGGAPPDLESVAARVADRIAREWVVGPRPVINATGVLLHTNLGRAPLSAEALAAMVDAASYADVEYDAPAGGRGSRQDHLRGLLVSLSGAESAYVAVNAAAAMTLALTALARGREVIVSRGHAVEIGGGFRVPAILRQSGARLVEVGTTNRTRAADYEEATSSRTAAVLHVHSSNFRIIGFTEQVELADLAELAHRHGVLCIDDNGSGSFLDTADYGLRHEPTPLESIRAGADLVGFSGDKLLGGPQAGILLGRADLIRKLSSHPLARALRPDKITIAGLSATLLAYLRGEAEHTLPLWRMIGQSGAEMARRAEGWRARAAERGIEVEVRPGESTVGGGSLPGETLPTSLLVLPAGVRPEQLRAARPPVVARAAGGRVLLDLRTVPEDREEPLLDAVATAVGRIDRRKRAVLDSGAK